MTLTPVVPQCWHRWPAHLSLPCGHLSAAVPAWPPPPNTLASLLLLKHTSLALCLRAFALAVPSAWYILPDICRVSFFTSCRQTILFKIQTPASLLWPAFFSFPQSSYYHIENTLSYL